jgi:hypothetical protein
MGWLRDGRYSQLLGSSSAVVFLAPLIAGITLYVVDGSIHHRASVAVERHGKDDGGALQREWTRIFAFERHGRPH